MTKISAVLTVFNEEKNLEKCLKSLSFVDEIVIVDNNSTDNTVEIAKNYTDKIYFQNNNPKEIDLQKNFGFEKAANDWIISLDADEEVSMELAQEIKSVLSAKPSAIALINGFWINRKNYIFGKWMEQTGWNPDFQLRLFRKNKGKFTKKHVHEPIHVEGETEKLKNYIIHNNYESVSQFLSKMSVYAQNEAENLLENGYKFTYFDSIRMPLSEFLTRFFAKQGYKDSFHGLMLSILMAIYHFVVFAYVWESKGFVQYNNSEFLKETEKEFKKAGKEIFYWLTLEKINGIKNPLKKTYFKIKNKLNT